MRFTELEIPFTEFEISFTEFEIYSLFDTYFTTIHEITTFVYFN